MLILTTLDCALILRNYAPETILPTKQIRSRWKCHVSMALRRDNTASQLFKHAGVNELPYLRVTTKGTLTRGSHRGGNLIRVWQRPINKQITELTTDAKA